MNFTPDKEQIAYLRQHDKIPDNSLSGDDTQHSNTEYPPAASEKSSGSGCLIFFFAAIIILYLIGKA